MPNTFFECSASLKFLMKQKKQCQIETFGWGLSDLVSLLVCNKSKYEADVEHSVMSWISSSLGYVESTYQWNSLLIDKTSLIYRNVESKATASGYISSDIESSEFRLNTKTKFANKGAQFVPMGIPTTATKILYLKNSSIFFISTSENLCV
jgi:hypothetical protein